FLEGGKQDEGRGKAATLLASGQVNQRGAFDSYGTLSALSLAAGERGRGEGVRALRRDAALCRWDQDSARGTSTPPHPPPYPPHPRPSPREAGGEGGRLASPSGFGVRLSGAWLAPMSHAPVSPTPPAHTPRRAGRADPSPSSRPRGASQSRQSPALPSRGRR